MYINHRVIALKVRTTKDIYSQYDIVHNIKGDIPLYLFASSFFSYA